MVIERNSSLLGKITILVMVSFVVNTAVALDGSGTQEDPWRIRSLDDFNDFAADANYWDDYTRLETDVNLAGRIYSRAVIAPDTTSSAVFQGTSFTGVFDGNDHKIINLTIDGGVSYYLGLFGYINDGEVRNLGIEGGSVSGNDWYVGSLAGYNGGGNVSNCYSTGDVSASERVGGLVGRSSYASSVSNCYSTGSVNGYWYVGGMVGVNYGSFSNCYSTGDVSASERVGGLMGQNYYGIVSKCYSTGDVSGNFYVGGLIGENYGSFSNCYSTGDVSGYASVGGLIGWNSMDSSVSNCCSTGDVSGNVDSVGGLVGENFYGSISNCFWDIDTQTNGVTESIGDNRGSSANVAGLSTYQLHQKSTFTDWDFINVWTIGEKQTYPYLRIYLSSDINKDGIVNFLDLSITANQWMEGVE